VTFALVIGAGPAGLMAAGALADAGLSVVVAEAKPSPARKFLMAGKSGLNITKSEPPDRFAASFHGMGMAPLLAPVLADFGPDQVMQWCRDLGQEVFIGSTGRVFPKAMKGSPLLRAWLARLAGQGVDLRPRWRWTGWQGDGLSFDTFEGPQTLRPQVTVLCLGGASWARLGSDGGWAPLLAARGVDLAPFQPANMGFLLPWSPKMVPFFGRPVKGVALHAAGQINRGEFVISAQGIEGGGVYALSRLLREGAGLTLDLMPDVAMPEVVARLAAMKPGLTVGNRLRRLGLSPEAAALVLEWGRHLPMAEAVKTLPVPLAGPRPMDQAISTAGGVTAAALTPALELRALPGVFVAGEMLDWEAPTGGYLLTGCLATGLWAGRHAAEACRR
jgi:uncharacterized flavoprotein (TIGR03862 family)